MKKILHLFKDFYPSRGGIQTAIKAIAELTPEFEHTVLAASGGKGSETMIGDIKVINVTSYGSFLSLPLAPAYIFKAASMMPQYDIVCVHYPFPLAELSLMLKRHRHVVFFWHSEIVSQKKARLFVDPMTKFWLKRAKKIFISYPEMAANSPLLNKWQEKAHLCPYSYERTEGVRKPLFLNNYEIDMFMLAVGRLVPYKGYKYLIEAMKSVHPEMKLIIAGAGPEREELERLVQEYGLGERIIIVSGLDEEELNYLRKECEFFVFPSCMNSEAFGIAQIEAMAHGKAVVNTNLTTGVAWVARDGEEGLTAENENPESLAEKINTLISDRALLEDLSKNALSRARDTFSPEKHRENLMKYFSNIGD